MVLAIMFIFFVIWNHWNPPSPLSWRVSCVWLHFATNFGQWSWPAWIMRVITWSSYLFGLHHSIHVSIYTIYIDPYVRSSQMPTTAMQYYYILYVSLYMSILISHTYIQLHTHTYTHTQTHTHMHIYIYYIIHTHTYIYMYTYTLEE